MGSKTKIALGAAAILIIGAVAVQLPRWRMLHEIDTALAAAKLEEQRTVDIARKGAEAGDAKSQYGLAVFYEKGYGVVLAKDENQAVFWYRRAAGQGHVEARRALDAYSKREAPPSTGR